MSTTGLNQWRFDSRSIDDPMLSILSLCGSGLQSSNITTSKRLRDGKTDELLSGEDLGDNLPLDFLATKIEDGRQTNDRARHETCSEHYNLLITSEPPLTITVTALAMACQLLIDNHLVEIIKLLGFDDSTHELQTLQMLSRTHAHSR